MKEKAWFFCAFEKWYKFELRDWAEDFTNSNNLSLSGLFDENQVKKFGTTN